MNTYKVAVIPGDGIGPEVTKEALKIYKKIETQLKSILKLADYDLGAAQYLKTKEADFFQFGGFNYADECR